MKSVLFINRVYPPDEGATGQLLAELAEALAREGWRVTVLAAGGRSPIVDRQSSMTIHRVRALPFTRASLWRRGLSYASLYPALLWRVLRLPRRDVVVTLTDPPLQLLLAPWIKFFKGSRLVHWAQDVYPEVAEELGVLRRGGSIARILRALSTWALRRHDTVVVVGRCMKERLRARGVLEERISVVPNWALAVGESPIANRQSPIVAPFTVMYSGNFGLAHPFESILEAVKILDRERAPVRFVFAGSGPRLASIREQLAMCGNTEFRGPAPLPVLSASLAAADVHLACMGDELLGLVVPSKVYGALAAGRPCVFLGPRECEVARLLVETGRGVVLPARASGADLAALLRRWAGRDPEYAALREASVLAARSTSGVPVEKFRHALTGDAAAAGYGDR